MSVTSADMAGSDSGSEGANEERLVDDGRSMSFFDHLSELRQRVIKSLLGVVATFFFLFALAYSSDIIRFLERPFAVYWQSVSMFSTSQDLLTCF